MSIPPERTVEKMVVITKTDASSMVGMTLAMFTREGDNPEALPRIHHLHEAGLAAASGQLQIDDILVSVNGVDAQNDVVASKLIRDAQGEIILKIRRPIVSSDFVVTLNRADTSMRLGISAV